VGGRSRGLWCAGGVTASNALQGAAAVTGLGAFIVRIEPLFLAVKWAGIAYLAVLSAQALRSARRGEYASQASDPGQSGPRTRTRALQGFRQGFMSNITNPKVLVFYLAVLPQFLGPRASLAALALYAASHALLSLMYLSGVTAAIQRARRAVESRSVRRWLDAVTGVALAAFATRLALEHA
jgi:threonine/homoserine/homoserine lactone efflux protein